MIEVEIRAKIENISLVKESLNSIGARFIKTIRQEDRIFGHPKFLDENTKIIEGGLSARIRGVNNIFKVEFKEIVRQGGGIEVSAELDDANEGVELLNKLGFEESFTILKTRDVYEYNGFEIALDEVEKLGSFIEIEKMVKSQEETAEAREECMAVLKQISPESSVINEKYGDMMQNIINKHL